MSYMVQVGIDGSFIDSLTLPNPVLMKGINRKKGWEHPLPTHLDIKNDLKVEIAYVYTSIQKLLI